MPEVRLEVTDDEILLINDLVTVEVRLNRGTYAIRSSGQEVVDAAVTVVTADGSIFSTRGEDLEFVGTKDATRGKGLTAFFSRETAETEPEVHLLITLCENESYIGVRAEVQNLAVAPLRVRELRPLDGGVWSGKGPGLRFYKHGWQSWSPTIVLDCDGEDIASPPPVVGPGTQPPAAPARFVSDGVAAVVDPATYQGVVCGFVSAADQFSHVIFDRSTGSLTAISHADEIEVRHRDVLSSEELYVELANEPVQSLLRFGETLGTEMDALVPEEVSSGWCSWYYYWQGISEAEFIANLDHIAANRDELPFDYVQLDDGYQAEIGDWLIPNEKFPHGMKWLADQVHERRFKAGIWLAPFIAGERSALYAEHPEWFVQSPEGGPALAIQNWGQSCYALDLANPEVIEHIRSVFRTICLDWGYDYVKIDFIYGGAIDGIRHDPNVTRAQVYRRGLEAIREVVGSRFILACGNPQAASVGLVDGARVGPDVAPYWHPFNRRQPDFIHSDPAAINSIRNSINRFWMHNRLWANDPDCLLVRDTDIALSGDEVRTLATVIAMTGGMVLSSDNLPKLSRERQRIISQMLPPHGVSAMPLDMFHAGDVPRVFVQECGTHYLMALFNWEDAEAVVGTGMPEGDWHLFEFWGQEYVGIVNGGLATKVPGRGWFETSVPGRGCRLFRVTPVADHPLVVGSTLHFSQGLAEISSETWDGTTLAIVLTPVACADGSIYVWKDGEVVEVPVTGLRERRTITV